MKLGFVSAILDGWTFEEMGWIRLPDWGMSAWKPLAGPRESGTPLCGCKPH